MFDNIIEKAKEIIEKDSSIVLVEIVDANGATPRGIGAFMFVDKNKISYGTVGGGNVEYMATSDAYEFLIKKSNGTKNYDLSQNGNENIGMVCGGNTTMRFTYLINDDASKEIIKKLYFINENKNVVYIFGGGHVSIELAKILKYVGFDYVVWDDRADFANSDRFKDAKKIICKSYDDIYSEIDIKENDFVVIMTRGHAFDYDVEKQILKKKPYYIGCIGSREKNRVLYEKLLADGYDKNLLDNIHAPIGIQIAADTPEEIAISIASELILYRAKQENRRKVIEGKTILK